MKNVTLLPWQEQVAKQNALHQRRKCETSDSSRSRSRAELSRMPRCTMSGSERLEHAPQTNTRVHFLMVKFTKAHSTSQSALKLLDLTCSLSSQDNAVYPCVSQSTNFLSWFVPFLEPPRNASVEFYCTSTWQTTKEENFMAVENELHFHVMFNDGPPLMPCLKCLQDFLKNAYS